MPLIDLSCLYLFSKVVKHGIHHTVFTEQFNLGMLAVKKLKRLFREISDAVLPWFRDCFI